MSRLPALLAMLVMVLSGGIVGYEPVATLVNNYVQHQDSAAYTQQVQARLQEADGRQQVDAQLKAAEDYNKTLDGVVVSDPFGDVSPAATEKLGRYMALLPGDDGVMSRVRVPSAGIDLLVRHGTGDRVLASGAGHLYGTSLPVGGEDTHAVITGHTGYQTATLFDKLTDVRPGDLIHVDTLGRHLTYKVAGSQVVLPEESGPLAVVRGRDLVTLVTCTPYGVNTHRLLVTGERVQDEQAPAGGVSTVKAEALGLPFHLKVLGAVGAALVACGLFVVPVVTRPRSKESR